MAEKRSFSDNDDDEDALDQRMDKLKSFEALVDGYQKSLTDALSSGNVVLIQAYTALLDSSNSKLAKAQQDVENMKVTDVEKRSVAGARKPADVGGSFVTPGHGSFRKIVSTGVSTGGRSFTCGSLVLRANSSLYVYSADMSFLDFSKANKKLADELWVAEMTAKGIGWEDVFDTVPKEQHAESRTPKGQYTKAKGKAIKYAMKVVFGRKQISGDAVAEEDDEGDASADVVDETGTFQVL
jgi:hypothetical protein